MQASAGVVRRKKLEVGVEEAGDSVLGLALKRYVREDGTEQPANGYTDHKDYHDHSDCICLIGGL